MRGSRARRSRRGRTPGRATGHVDRRASSVFHLRDRTPFPGGSAIVPLVTMSGNHSRGPLPAPSSRRTPPAAYAATDHRTVGVEAAACTGSRGPSRGSAGGISHPGCDAPSSVAAARSSRCASSTAGSPSHGSRRTPQPPPPASLHARSAARSEASTPTNTASVSARLPLSIRVSLRPLGLRYQETRGRPGRRQTSRRCVATPPRPPIRVHPAP